MPVPFFFSPKSTSTVLGFLVGSMVKVPASSKSLPLVLSLILSPAKTSLTFLASSAGTGLPSYTAETPAQVPCSFSLSPVLSWAAPVETTQLKATTKLNHRNFMATSKVKNQPPVGQEIVISNQRTSTF